MIEFEIDVKVLDGTSNQLRIEVVQLLSTIGWHAFKEILGGHLL